MQELLKHFHKLSLHPKSAKELKGLILQLAIQGKLTANWRLRHPELVSGSKSGANLLENIKAEKAKLVKKKEIKKEKALPVISENEFPFLLPKSWTWCRLVDVTEYIQRGKSPKYSEVPKIPVVSQKCVQWSGFDISRARFITEDSLEKYQKERFLIEGDLLWNSTGNGTIGRTILLPQLEFDQIVADSHVTVVRPFRDSLISEYLWIYSASPLVQETIEGRVSGSTKQTELGTGTVKALEFALPPLEEQEVIVKTVEILFQEVEALENLTENRIELKKDYATSALNQLAKNNSKAEWQALKPQFHTFFNEVDNIKKLRETILQLAVRGKLTAKWRAENPELISGENSSENLLKEIKAEKAKLIKEKKIKKEKALPPIIEDEVPYELPESWVWVKMGAIIELISGQHISSRNYNEKGIGYSYLTGPSDFRKVNPKISKWTENPKVLAQKNDILITVKGSGVGKLNILHQNNVAISRQLMAIRNKWIDSKFLFYFLDGDYANIQNQKVGIAIPGISREDLLFKNFPLPSLNEQRVLVEKIKLLMDLCDQLEREVENSQKQIEGLMQSVLKEAFVNQQSYEKFLV